jgi:flavin-dependent dehydrogenase
VEAEMNAGRLWDAIIIGAGPAGSLAAFLLARLNYSVLLVDKARFPRHKVCGCCLNGVSLQLLNKFGLGKVIECLDPVPLHSFCLRTPGNSLEINLLDSVALSREALDLSLISCAVNHGAVFLAESTAYVSSAEPTGRNVSITNENGEALLKGRVVIVADGITGRSLEKLPEFAPQIQAGSRIGAGTVLSFAPSYYRPGTIYMSSGKGGYVGMVRLEDARLDLACAFDLEFVRSSGGPANAALKILTEAGMIELPELRSSIWQGTGALTRSRRRKAAERLFVIGDAAAYAEPFTGEGISWALMSASAVVPIASAAIKSWSARLVTVWTKEHSRLIGSRQSTSASLARLLRSAKLTTLSLEALKRMPYIADALLLYLNSPAKTLAIDSLNESTYLAEG